MVTALALAAALAYGIADFLGGAAARRATALRVLTWSIPAGIVLLAVAALLDGGTVTPPSLVWGFFAGLAGGTGLLAFYRALARGPMSVVAPVSALAAAVLPVAVGTLRGEDLPAGVLFGVALCVAAIGLISMEESSTAAEPSGEIGSVAPRPGSPGTESRAPVRLETLRRLMDNGPLMAGVSGVAIGVFFILLKEAGSAGGGLWPLVAGRTGGLLVILTSLLVLARLRRPARPARSARSAWSADSARPADSARSAGSARSTGAAGAEPGVRSGPRPGGLIAVAVLSGLLDAGANVLYYVAARDGLLSLAAVLTSLYPAITVLLARIVYSERLRMVQRLGLAVAAAGITLVTVG